MPIDSSLLLTDGDRQAARAAFSAWARWRWSQDDTGVGYPRQTAFARWIVSPWNPDDQIRRNHTRDDCVTIDRIIHDEMLAEVRAAVFVRYHVDPHAPRSNNKDEQARYLGVHRTTLCDRLALAEEALVLTLRRLDAETDFCPKCGNQ